MTPHAPDSNGAPQKIALVSDVHGNLPAFRSVLADVERSEPDAVWCLGDLVGYGAQPDGCVELAAARCDLALAGNHDLGVLGRIDISDFSPHAAAAALWTRENICSDTRGVPLRPRAPARWRGDRPLPRQPARPGVGLRDLGLRGGPLHGRDGGARGRHRAHPRGLALHPHRHRGARRGGGGRQPSRPLRATSGW